MTGHVDYHLILFIGLPQWAHSVSTLIHFPAAFFFPDTVSQPTRRSSRAFLAFNAIRLHFPSLGCHLSLFPII